MNKMLKILVIDDEENYRNVYKKILSKRGYDIDVAINGKAGIKLLDRGKYDLVLTDLIMEGIDGIEVLESIKGRHPDTGVILVTGYGTVKNAVEAMKKGAFSYFIKSHDIDELLIEVKKYEELTMLRNENKALKSNGEKGKFIIETKNPEFLRVLNIAEKAAKSNTNILILGESGTGKEVMAQYIHNCSDRCDKRFVPINCNSYPDNLIESELYGYEKGAFTGAVTKKQGRIELAHEGTLFLDEIGDIEVSTQIKLLRTIENKRFERLGSNISLDVDFRLISATNNNLKESILQNKFREDFFYRIGTIVLKIPPLRERKEDIPLLVDFFLEQAQRSFNKSVIRVEDSVTKYLCEYDYPGNIRELKNIIDRLVVLSENGVIKNMDMNTYYNLSRGDSDCLLPFKESRKIWEESFITNALKENEYNVSQTARKLELSRRQLINKINEYNIET